MIYTNPDDSLRNSECLWKSNAMSFMVGMAMPPIILFERERHKMDVAAVNIR